MRKYTSKPVEDLQFELDDVVFHVPGTTSLLDLVDLAELSDADVTDPRAIKAVSGLFRDILGEDYDRFHKHVKAHRTDNGTLIEIIQDLVQESVENTGFPTQQPSDTLPGTTPTVPTYTVVSPSNESVVRFPMTPEREIELRQAVETARAVWESKAG
jgi:hypothetical protein